jgi:hypothetical protein
MEKRKWKQAQQENLPPGVRHYEDFGDLPWDIQKYVPKAQLLFSRLIVEQVLAPTIQHFLQVRRRHLDDR